MKDFVPDDMLTV